MNNFQKRIHYQGDLKSLLVQTCKDFDIGIYSSHSIIPIGYEDFNLKLSTSKDNYFVKIFASFRNENDCKRYVDVISSVLESGVAHPNLYKSSQGFLYQISLNGSIDRLCVMEYITEKSFFETQSTPDPNDVRLIIKQASLINSIDIKPAYIYDNWAIVNFPEQYEKKKQYLDKKDDYLITPLINQLNQLSLNILPYTFVHGDITKTNTIKGPYGKIRIIDFAVSNYYPRILELSALFSDLFFETQNPDSFMEVYKFALNEYQQYLPLTPEELIALPTCVKLTHAMHILCANYDKIVLKNSSNENNYYLNNGRLGLKHTTKLWK